jgi:NAD(P)-dependent dehydrogenase (short-subunit alcohol dehydrogenase family)
VTGPGQPQTRTIAVTGASRGIGRAIALTLAGPPTQLLLLAHSHERLSEVARAASDRGARAEVLAIDLRIPTAALSVRDALIDRFGGVDVLINSAGATRVDAFERLTEKDWDDGFSLKFHGARRLAVLLWPLLAERRGSIVNIVGSAGRTPGPSYALGGSVNAALLGLTKSLAQRGIVDGVQVNAINPGPTRTERLEGILASRARDHGTSVEQEATRLISESGIERIGDPNDVASLVAYLLSPPGRLLQGSLIDADAGQTKAI